MGLLIENRPVHTGYIRIENRDQFLTTVPNLHPLSEEYRQYWGLQFLRSIEGMWGQMSSQWRYMPGKLYYYGNFFQLKTTKKKVTTYARPSIDDLEWELHYGFAEAQGFSGFANDERRSALRILNENPSTEYLREHHPSAFDSQGLIKTYVPARKLLYSLHDRPLGRALFENDTQNFMLFGSRGGGKSYIVAGLIEHNLIFDGATVYDQSFLDGANSAEMAVGSSVKDRSGDLLKKVKESIESKAHAIYGAKMGVWGKPGDMDFTPCPIFRDMIGSLDAPNKNNPYRHEHRIKTGGRWLDQGSSSRLYHVNYSINKGDGSQAAVGGRYLLSVVEEVGLVENVVDVQGANEATLWRDHRFGYEMYIGTSGNMGKVGGARKMFLDPRSYNVVAYKNNHGNEGANGEVGFFLPFYMTLRQFKDKNGNTDYDAAIAYVQSIRADRARSKDPRVLKDERMNRPCFVDEMWLTDMEDIFPREELEQTQRYLLEGNRYQQIRTPVRLIWDSSTPKGVRYQIDTTLQPYDTFPLDHSKRTDPRGCVVIFDFPRILPNGDIPADLYCFVGHDPYVEENWLGGGSVGATYILINPKYVTSGMPGNIIVASYIDKPINGLTEYYENQEKLLALYGNPPMGLWYEKNRGQDCRAHYVKKNKTHLLAPTPQFAEGTDVRQKNIVSFGYVVGNKLAKVRLAKQMRDWMLEETEFHTGHPSLLDGKRKNVERLNCLYLVQQCLAYNLDDNFDAVDGFRGCIVGLNEVQTYEESILSTKQIQSGMLRAYANNPKFFKDGKGLLSSTGTRLGEGRGVVQVPKRQARPFQNHSSNRRF